MYDPRCVTWPCQYILSVTTPFEELCSTVPNMLLSNAAPIVRAVAFHSHLAPPHPEALPLLSVQPNELRHALNSSSSTFVSNLVLFGAICILVVAAMCRAHHVLRRFRASKLSHHTSFRRPHRSILVSAITAFLFAACIHSVAAADTAVVVDPSKGQDVPDCGLSDLAPCLTIHYALHIRRATSVLLSEGIFSEINIYVDSFVSVFSASGSRNSTVFDCGRRGPAFIIANTSVTIAGITFQNCVNLFNASGTGGAISAHSNSVITVTDCGFYNNTAQTGGAIGANSSSLSVSSSLFENNTATCPNASAACSAWGGAIGAVEALSVIIENNNFNRNTVNLELNGLRDPPSRAAAGGGCVSVLYNSDVSDSRVTIDGNTFQSCSVRISGSRTLIGTSGVQYGNAYGGAVSLYYGLRAANSLQVRNVVSSFTNNICGSSVIISSVGVGGSVYGGCLSVNTGAWSVSATGSSSVGSLYVDNMRTNVSGNRLENCGAFISIDALANGAIAYGGGISVAVGAYSYSGYGGGPSSVSGDTTVSSSSYAISSNTLINCIASLSTSSISSASSSGTNVYGGGISVSVGAYSCSQGGKSVVSGNTAISSSSYAISSNTLTSCIASLSTSSISYASSASSIASNGTNVHGGGISVAVGAYSYGQGGSSSVSGVTTVSSSSYAISSNTLTSCIASLSTSSISSASSVSSNGTNVYGGGILVAVGAYSFSGDGDSFYFFSSISGDTIVSNTSYAISSNTLTNCTASSTSSSFGDESVTSISSNGVNAYGGGISVAVGACSYSGGGKSVVSGNTAISSSSYAISSNTLINCTASSTSSISVTTSSSGANVYGGGISVAVGACSFSQGGKSVVSGNTAVSNTSYAISSNTLTNCTASSTTSSAYSLTALATSSGANVYGGCISVAVGAYSYSVGDSSSVSGVTTVSSSSSSSYTISSNTLTNCTASSTTSSSYSLAALASSSGANVYGGCISFAVGVYSYGLYGGSSVSGDTTISSSSYAILSNKLTNCYASSTTSSSCLGPSSATSSGTNVYGSGISVTVGAFSYGRDGDSSVSGDTTVSSSSYAISSNTLINCTASSTTSSTTPFSGVSLDSLLSSSGANVYGGCISVAVGAYSYSGYGGGPSSVSGDTTVSSSSYAISSNTLINCTASSRTSSFVSSTTSGANVYGGGISVSVGAYSYRKQKFGDDYSSDSGVTTVNSSSYTIASNTLTNCTASTTTSSSTSSITSGANVYGGCISISVGAYLYGVDIDFVVSSVFMSSCIVKVINMSCAHCSSKSSTSGFSNEAFSFGGAVSTLFESYAYPKTAGAFPAVTLATTLMFSSCNFSQSIATSSSLTCSPGGSSAAGGAIFSSVVSTDVSISSSVFFVSRVRTGCAASSSQTFSLGGGVSVFRAGNVVLNESNITYCRAIGVRQANNVLVGGGGIYVEGVESVTLERSFVSACSVEDAFSVRVLPCGGGAIGITNTSAVRISNSNIYNNSDSSLSGAILLQQLTTESDMVVNVTNGSVLSSDPSISMILPVLKIFCGSNCSVEQQQRMRLNVMGSTILAQKTSDYRYQSAVVMALPRWSMLSGANSHFRCNFSGVDSIAALVESGANQMLVTCAPCEKPFHIAPTSSSTMNLSNFSLFAAQPESRDSCRPLISQTSGGQSCPYGISSCSTVVYITVGFWTRFAADGSISDVVRCPSNYCGCRNIPGYNQPTCQLYPPFAEEYQPDDALCNGNRTGVLCGSCKQNFTQSLNGFSCVPNNVCSEARPLVWILTVVGYIVYAFYIVISSMTISSGLITCVLFYGQLSSFGSLPPHLFDASQTSFAASWFSKVTQFGSVMSLYDNACYGLDMGAYEATAAQLCGPAIVLTAALLLTAAGHRLLPKISRVLHNHNVEIRISLRVTSINVLLLLFSSVTSVIFQLITCQQVGAEKVVFIDGNKKCEGPLHGGMLAVAVVLSVFPVVFWLLLKFNKISAATKSVVCSAYTDSKYYWGAMSLLFRFLMTVLYATARNFPSVTAFALLVSSICMALLLAILRPYAQQRAYYMDLFCYVCLIVQYAVQVLVRASESLGFAVVEANSFRPVLLNAVIASQVLRCACEFTHSIVSYVAFTLGRYAPFVVFGLLFFSKAVWRAFLRLGFGPGCFARSTAAAVSSVELRSQLESHNEDLKSKLLR